MRKVLHCKYCKSLNMTGIAHYTDQGEWYNFECLDCLSTTPYGETYEEAYGKAIGTIPIIGFFERYKEDDN